MSFFEKVESVIREALGNSQDCPICGAEIFVAGADNNGVNYDHECDCLLDVMAIQKIPYEEDSLEYRPDECELYDPKNKNRLHSYYDEVDISKDCEVYDKIPDSKKIKFLNKPYKRCCHKCNKTEGVDSNHKDCVEDPPYGFRCKHCGHSLRTHKNFGNGKKFDMELLNTTWYFDKNRHPKLYEKTQFQNKTTSFPTPLF